VVRLNAPQLKGAYAERKAALDNLALSPGSSAAATASMWWSTRWPWTSARPAGNRTCSCSSARPDAAEESWQVQADRLDLTPLTPLIDALAPLPDNLMAVVDGLKVTGALRNVRLDIRPKAEGDQRAVRRQPGEGRFRRLSRCAGGR
jgi:uncharacterized protein YhdP